MSHIVVETLLAVKFSSLDTSAFKQRSQFLSSSFSASSTCDPSALPSLFGVLWLGPCRHHNGFRSSAAGLLQLRSKSCCPSCPTYLLKKFSFNKNSEKVVRKPNDSTETEESNRQPSVLLDFNLVLFKKFFEEVHASCLLGKSLVGMSSVGFEPTMRMSSEDYESSGIDR